MRLFKVVFLLGLVSIEYSALSYTIPSSPTKVSEGGTKSAVDMTLSNKKFNPKNRKKVWVRLPIKLTTFKEVSIKKPDNTLVKKSVVASSLNRLLRSDLVKENHFYIEDYHIETTPISWNKQWSRYSVNLSIYKRYGEYKQLEELVGTVEVEGKLTGKTPIYEFDGRVSKRFLNKLGRPIVEVNVGSVQKNLAKKLKQPPKSVTRKSGLKAALEKAKGQNNNL